MKTKPLSHYVQAYFLSYLIAQRGYGRNTVTSYRDTFKLLFTFLEENKLSVSKLSIENVDKKCVMEFLDWLESRRKNAISTRNLRLAHLKSFWGMYWQRPQNGQNIVARLSKSHSKKQKRNPLPI